MDIKELLKNLGVTDPSQMQWRSGALSDDLSAADRGDMWGAVRADMPGNSTGVQQNIGQGWWSPDGTVIKPGANFTDPNDRYRHFILNASQDGKNTPTMGSYYDAPDISWGDAAMMIAGTIAAAYGIDAMGAMGAAGAGADAGGAATMSGMDLAADGGANALSGFGAGGSGADIGAANALSDGNYAGADFGAQPDIGLQNSLSDASYQGADWGGAPDAASNVSDYNYTNEMDKLSDASTAGGHAVDGTINSGVNTGGPGANISSLGFDNPVKSWMSGMKPTDVLKFVSALTSGGSKSGSGSGGGGAGGSTTKEPFDYGAARYLPPGWRTDRPMYIPGQDAIPDGWFGAGHTGG